MKNAGLDPMQSLRRSVQLDVVVPGRVIGRGLSADAQEDHEPADDAVTLFMK